MKAAVKMRASTLSPHKIPAASFQLTRTTLHQPQQRGGSWPSSSSHATLLHECLESFLRAKQLFQAETMRMIFQRYYPSLLAFDTWNISQAGR